MTKRRIVRSILSVFLSLVLIISGFLPGMPFVSTVYAESTTKTITPGTDDAKTGTGTMEISLTIKKTPAAGDFAFTPPTSPMYDGQPKAATVSTEAEGMGEVTVEYYNGDTKLSGAPTAEGTYTVKVNVAEGDDYKAATGITDDSWTFTIAPMQKTMTITLTIIEKDPAVVTKAPTAKTLTYNGSAQELVTAGTASGGTMQYALGEDASTTPTTGWSTSIPTATDAGTYYVWYRVIGDATHADSNVVSMDAIKIKPGAPKVTDLRANKDVFDYANGKFKQNSQYEIYVGTSIPDANAAAIGVGSGGYDLLTNIVDAEVNNDTDTSNDKKLYVRMTDGETTSNWVYVPLPKRQSTSGIAVDYSKDTISGVYKGVLYSTGESTPSTEWPENGSSDLTKSPISWNGTTSKTLKFMVPGDQDNQLFPSKVKEITLSAKGEAPTETNLVGYTQGSIPAENITYRSATLPTAKESTNKNLQYRYGKHVTSGNTEWTSWGSSNKAIGLDMGTQYDFEVRFAPETNQNGIPTGPASQALSGTFTTKITKPDINDILDRYIDYSTGKFTNLPADTYEYALTANAESTAWMVCANENDVPGGESGFYIRYKNAGNGQPSAATFIPATTIPTDVNAVTPTNEEVKGLGGSFGGTGNTMEYRYRKDSGSVWTTWIPCTSNMTGLAAGQYQIRKKASGSGNPSFAKQFDIVAGSAANVTVTVKDKDENNIEDATVKATTAGSANQVGGTNNNNGTYTISNLSAGTYMIVATGTDGHEVTTLLTITSLNHAVTITLPTGNENSSKLVDNTGKNIVVGGIDEQAKKLDDIESTKEYVVSFKAEEKSAASGDVDISSLKTTIESDSIYNNVDVQQEFMDFTVEKTLVSDTAGDANIGTTEAIHATAQVMEIIYPYPQMDSRFGIQAWRYHGTQVDKFKVLASRPTGNFTDGTYYIDRLNKRIFLYGSKFSTYSISYTENSEVADPVPAQENGGIVNPGGNVNSGGNNNPAVTSYTVTFNANGGSGTMKSQIFTDKAALRANTFTRTGYSFDGWNTKADGSGKSYLDEEIIMPRENMTLYAQWKKGSSDSGDDTDSDDPDNSDDSDNGDVTANGKSEYANEISINSGLKVSQTGNKLNVSWGKVKGANRYEVYVAYCGSKFAKKPVKTITKSGTTSVTIKKLNGKKISLKKNFKVYVVAYKTVNGKNKKLGKTITAHVIGCQNTKYTNVKSIKLKKSKVTLKKGKTTKIKASVVLVDPNKKILPDSHEAKFRYASSNKKIATVTKNGKIKAKKKGTCYIWVYAKNGYAKKVKVTVK
ncbi:Listeria/Bacterioides repeat-containing protein [Lachnospiraceae bacterium KHCPX20]|nr:Listeria/Bacterioides repeat-containing protein [Lachnospiraceae bacterium KHCPX20]